MKIQVPVSGTLTRLEAMTVSGTVPGRGSLSVSVSGVVATVTGSTWEAVVPLVEGDNTITAVAKSGSGRESQPDSVMVTRDGIPPTVDLQTPESIGRDEPGRGRVDASDNLPGVVVRAFIGGVAVGPAAPPPYEFDIVAPPQAPSGSTLEVRAVATDRAGNSSSPLSRSVRIAAAGVVVGQVLSDETGLPLAGATVILETPAGPKTALSDERGGYSFPTGGAMARLQADKAGMIAVEREVVVGSDVGTVVLDSRLTPLAEAVAVGAGGLVLPKVDAARADPDRAGAERRGGDGVAGDAAPPDAALGAGPAGAAAAGLVAGRGLRRAGGQAGRPRPHGRGEGPAGGDAATWSGSTRARGRGSSWSRGSRPPTAR